MAKKKKAGKKRAKGALSLEKVLQRIFTEKPHLLYTHFRGTGVTMAQVEEFIKSNGAFVTVVNKLNSTEKAELLVLMKQPPKTPYRNMYIRQLIARGIIRELGGTSSWDK